MTCVAGFKLKPGGVAGFELSEETQQGGVAGFELSEERARRC